MGLTVNINSITGISPYDVYICQSDGTGCIYINQITTTPYSFEIPSPYDNSLAYMLKIIDGEGCQITEIKEI